MLTKDPTETEHETKLTYITLPYGEEPFILVLTFYLGVHEYAMSQHPVLCA